MDSLCQQYLAQVARLYGDGCAAASVCQPDDGDFLVGVSPERPRLHTRKQLERMVEVLSNRKPLKPANLPAMAVLAQKLERRKKDE